MTQIKNFTPHPINICNNAGKVIRVIQPEGLVRLKAVTVPAGEIDGVPVTKTEFGQPEGLPEFKEGVFIVVSQLVKNKILLVQTFCTARLSGMKKAILGVCLGADDKLYVIKQ